MSRAPMFLCKTIGCDGLRPAGLAWCGKCQTTLPMKVRRKLAELGQHIRAEPDDAGAQRILRVLLRQGRQFLQGSRPRGLLWQ